MTAILDLAPWLYALACWLLCWLAEAVCEAGERLGVTLGGLLDLAEEQSRGW